MIEHLLPQIVLHTFAQHAREIDAGEDHRRLQEDERPVGGRQPHDGRAVFHVDARVHNILVDEREIRVQRGHGEDGDAKAEHPGPVWRDQFHDALEHRCGELTCVFFFFDFDNGVCHFVFSIPPS